MSVEFEKIENGETLMCQCCRVKSYPMYRIITYSHVSPNDPKIFCEKCKEHPGYIPCPMLKKSFSSISK